MKYKYINPKYIIATMVLFVLMAGVVNAGWPLQNQPGYRHLLWEEYRQQRYDEWWDKVWQGYLAALHAAQMAYLQAWNENMQQGIKRLNNYPQTIGVTPVNGALLLNETDLVLPGRSGNDIAITRSYNSKIWAGDTSNGSVWSHLEWCEDIWMGAGWDLHFGKYWNEDSGKVFEAKTGLCTFFKHRAGSTYVATDGSFAIFQNDTIWTCDGGLMIFGYDYPHYANWHYLTKLVDPNGNVTDFYYRDTIYDRCRTPVIDSLITSVDQKVTFHWGIDPLVGYMSLDSIRYIGYNDIEQTVRYYYELANADSSPFGPISWPTFLLTKVKYPNGDSIYYGYNQYYELSGVHTAGGGLMKYEYGTDSFFIPYDTIFPPSKESYALLQLTRGIKSEKLYDQWTAPDTSVIHYVRTFRVHAANQAMSNADSVTIYDPDSNYTVFEFMASYAPHRDDKFQWNWDNGLLEFVAFYDSADVFLGKRVVYTNTITNDKICVLHQSNMYTSEKTYVTKFYKYDHYGNPGLIYEEGDSSITDDNRWIHLKYYHGGVTSFLKIDFRSVGLSSYYADIVFFSKPGADTLFVTRSWAADSSANPSDSVINDTIAYSPPCFEDSIPFQLKPYPDGMQWVKVEAWLVYNSETLYVYSVCFNLSPNPPEYGTPDGDRLFQGANDYTSKYIHNMLARELVSTDSVIEDTLSLKHYYYDDTNYLVKSYAAESPAQWEAPSSPSKIRGNLTRIEHWDDGNDFTKTEFRYDQVGNIVQSIAHVNSTVAETTFTYYDPPSPNQDKYQYAFPVRVVTHPDTGSSDSLFSRIDYDVATGLIVRSIDGSNSDSTKYYYDNMNRLTKAYMTNSQSVVAKAITYIDSARPQAVLDSVKLKSNQWAVSKSFYDGLGRIIQAQAIDENDSTIVQNISYSNRGLVDSVSNPYRISGTSLNYSSPSWSQVTTYKYKGLDRIVVFPGADSIMVKHYANIDTVFDEKGNKTIYKYNALGAIDTVFDALNNKTSYTYDRLGRLTKVINAENDSTMYYYDNLSRLIAMNCPDAKSSYSLSGDSVDVLYEYDDIGNLTRKIDANDTVDYYYDNINRLTKVKHSDGDSIRLIYDTFFWITGEPNNSKGRLTKMVTTGTDSMVYYYNDQGTVARKDIWITGLPGKKFLKYKYNDANQCTLMTLYPGTRKVNYHYDRLARLKEIPNLVDEFKYTPSSQILRIEYANDIIDTITYDNRLRPTRIKAYKNLTKYLDLSYKYQSNSNVDSIIDNITAAYTQVYTYDNLNRLTKVKLPSVSPADSQWFSYDKVGNRAAKNGTNYSYYSNTNRLYRDHQNHYYDYDDNGNIIRHRTGKGTIDSLIYDWNNRLIRHKKGDDTLAFAYNASGLRVKKHYHKNDGGDDGGDKGTLFLDSSDDLGVKSTGVDSTYNKGRDIEKVYIKNETNYFTFTIVNKHLFSTANKLKLFITLDLDTLVNSGRLTLPEDMRTKVPAKAAWEYCVYVSDNDYGFYKKDGTKVSKPFGMAVQKTTGDKGSVQVKILKSLINTPQAVRYTISTFDPQIPLPNPYPDTLFQGGSSACDVYPGTNTTFGGEINGYGEITSLGGKGVSVNDYTIYYVYNGINPIVEYSANGSILARYIYAGGLHIAKIVGADTHFYHCDALGSPRVMTDESALIKWQARYWPFGEMTKWGVGDNSHGFTGKEWDSEMGLNYFCQRYYDPEIGRFITLDPFGGYIELPQSQNRYAYCMANPLKYIDPLGLGPDDDVYYLSVQEENWEFYVYGGYIDIEELVTIGHIWNPDDLGGGSGDPSDNYDNPSGKKGKGGYGFGMSAGDWSLNFSLSESQQKSISNIAARIAELQMIENTYNEFHNQLDWGWGPWETAKWWTTWIHGQPGHNCTDFVDAAMDYLYTQTPVPIRYHELRFENWSFHTTLGVYYPNGYKSTWDPYFRIKWR